MDSRYGTTNAPTNVGDTGSVGQKANFSTFNYSMTKYCQGLFGAIMPIDLIEVIPNETVYIQNNVLVTPRVPLIRKLKNGVNVRVNYFYMAKKDLWEDWQAWYDGTVNGKGDSSLIYPKLSYQHKAKSNIGDSTLNATSIPTDHNCTSNDIWLTSLTPLSPYAYMGGEIPLCNMKKTDTNDQRETLFGYKEMIVKDKDNDYEPTSASDTKVKTFGTSPNEFTVERNFKQWDGTNGTKLEIDALRFVMYCRVCRDIYFNTALLQDNKLWYPDNENHFKLHKMKTTDGRNSNGYANMVNFDYSCLDSTKGTWVTLGHRVEKLNVPNNYYDKMNPYGANSSVPLLNYLYFRQWDADYFTSASPFEDLIKTANFWGGLVQKEEDISGYVDALTESASTMTSAKNVVIDDDPNGNTIGISGFTGSTAKNVIKNVLKTNSDINMNEVRSMLACNKMLQLVGTINTPNVYNTFIAKTYSIDPHTDNGKPIYIGGYNGQMQFNDIQSTGQYSNASGQAQPLGTKASNGILATSNEVGEFHVKDHGYIMGLMTIDVDTMYRYGLTKDWRRKTQMDYANPMFEGVSSAPINYGELKVPFYPTNSDEINTVWGHTCMNEDYKSRQNRATNYAQFPNKNKWDNSMYLCKEFSGIESADRLNNTNITMSPANTDLSLIFNEPNEVTFEIDFQSNIKRRMPLVNKAMPKQMW